MSKLKAHINNFMDILKKDTSIELYNEAGFQYELAFYLRQKLGNDFVIQLERNIEAIVGHKDFTKKELDIYFRNTKTGEKYCIEIKTPVNKQVPRIMQKSHEDIKFLEEMKAAGFTECYFIFLTLNKSFWDAPQKTCNIYHYFNEPSVELKTLVKDDVPDFIQKEAADGAVVKLSKVYKTDWYVLRAEKSIEWRYFIIEV